MSAISIPLNTDWGPFRPLEILSSGPVAEVYRACWNSGEGQINVALKVIQPQFCQDAIVSRLIQAEADLALTLKHPNIVRTLKCGTIEGRIFIAMQLVDGITGDQLISGCQEKKRLLSTATAVHVARKTLAGLKHVHGIRGEDSMPRGITHMALSPHNIYFTRKGQVLLTGFCGHDKDSPDAKSRAAGRRGSLRYAAPEHLADADIDGRTDVYGVAVLLYELLTGTSPIPHTDPKHIVDHIIHEKVVPPSDHQPDLPQDLSTIVSKGLATNPEDRYQFASDFSIALKKFHLKTDPMVPDDIYIKELISFVEVIAPRAGEATHTASSRMRTPSSSAIPKKTIYYNADKAEQAPAPHLAPPSAQQAPAPQPALPLGSTTPQPDLNTLPDLEPPPPEQQAQSSPPGKATFVLSQTALHKMANLEPAAPEQPADKPAQDPQTHDVVNKATQVISQSALHKMSDVMPETIPDTEQEPIAASPTPSSVNKATHVISQTELHKMADLEPAPVAQDTGIISTADSDEQAGAPRLDSTEKPALKNKEKTQLISHISRIFDLPFNRYTWLFLIVACLVGLLMGVGLYLLTSSK